LLLGGDPGRRAEVGSDGILAGRRRSTIVAAHGTDVLAVSEHGAPGRRPNIHAHFVGRQREDGLDTLPARAAEANRSTLIADIPFPAPGNVAAKRCASEKRAF